MSFTISRSDIDINLTRVPNTYLLGLELFTSISKSIKCQIIDENFKEILIVKTEEPIELYLTPYISQMSTSSNSFFFNYVYNRTPQNSRWLPTNRLFLEGDPKLISQIIQQYNLQIDKDVNYLSDNKELSNLRVYLPYNSSHDTISLTAYLSKLYQGEQSFLIEPDFLVTIVH